MTSARDYIKLVLRVFFYINLVKMKCKQLDIDLLDDHQIGITSLEQ